MLSASRDQAPEQGSEIGCKLPDIKILIYILVIPICTEMQREIIYSAWKYAAI